MKHSFKAQGVLDGRQEAKILSDQWIMPILNVDTINQFFPG